MAQNLILVFLIVGGMVGWMLFAVTLTQLICNRSKEIKIINEIQEDLKIIRDEINKLK